MARKGAITKFYATQSLIDKIIGGGLKVFSDNSWRPCALARKNLANIDLKFYFFEFRQLSTSLNLDGFTSRRSVPLHNRRHSLEVNCDSLPSRRVILGSKNFIEGRW